MPEIYENVIILTDGHETYHFNTDIGSVKTLEFSMSQVYLTAGCRLVELGSKANVINWTNKYKKAPAEDKTNWEFFSDE